MTQDVDEPPLVSPPLLLSGFVQRLGATTAGVRHQTPDYRDFYMSDVSREKLFIQCFLLVMWLKLNHLSIRFSLGGVHAGALVPLPLEEQPQQVLQNEEQSSSFFF